LRYDRVNTFDQEVSSMPFERRRGREWGTLILQCLAPLFLTDSKSRAFCLNLFGAGQNTCKSVPIHAVLGVPAWEFIGNFAVLSKIMLPELMGGTVMQSDATMDSKSNLGESSRKDFDTLRRDLAKLTQTVSDLAQTQTQTARGQVTGALSAASDQLAQSAAATQDKLISLEADLETYVRQKPLSSVLVALGVGFLLGRMSA
jgi:ElaB/YqjD/DUF883 family membrane-anchored ribosome-binding protein